MRVKLTKTHTHAGRQYRPGDLLVADEMAGDWIVKHERGVEVDADGRELVREARTPAQEGGDSKPNGDAGEGLSQPGDDAGKKKRGK